jgi:RES domain-containing protein
MHGYRIQKAKYAADISGIGSTLVSGRWHQAGKSPILYASSNVSLAILEYVVHLPPSVKPPELLLLTLEIPDPAIVTMAETDLPENWNKKGYHDNVQRWGTAWLESFASLAVMVPSATSPDHNILINPSHPDFHTVAVIDNKPITMDDRLI